MSGDDDDDFWANEDFIATIENVVKKAEEASAARHGGTPGAPTPRPSTVIPPQRINSQIGEASLPIRGTPHFHESLNSRPSNSSIAPPQWEAASDTAFRHGEHAKSPLFGTPHRLGEQEVPPQFINRQGRSSLAENVPKDVQSLHQSSQGLLWRKQHPGDKQAEQHLDDLRSRVGPQSAPHPSVYQQQVELERLSAQLLFKDHEISEAQRARAEKEERLKDALAETAALKEELERLKKSRQIGVESTQPRDEGDMDVAQNNAEGSGVAPALPLVSGRNIARVSKQGCDPWSPPWMPEGSSGGALGNTTAGLRAKMQIDAPDAGGCRTLQDEPPTIETLQLRTGGNGCVTSDGRESLKGDEAQARTGGASATVRADGEGSVAIQRQNSLTRTNEMYYALQRIWGLKGGRNDGISLVSKLNSSCREDLFTLLSSGESLGPLSHKKSDKGKEGQMDSRTISEKLHTALAKVTNGSAHPEIIITPLLEFCKLGNVNFIGSALHILRCILQHDSTCRKKLLLRGSQQGADHQVPLNSSSKTLEKEEKIAEGLGWYIKSVPKGSSSSERNRVVVFSSPRIRCHPQVGENVVQHLPGGRDVRESGVAEGGHEPPRPSDQLQQRAQKHKEEREPGDPSVPVEDLNILVKWLLDFALTASSPIVKYEAVAIIGVLVVNSEPLVERAMFGPLLCCGRIDLLLKESAGAEIQLQAVRIVHLLLYCPPLFQRICVVVKPKVVERETGNDINMDNQTENVPAVDGHNQEISIGQNRETAKETVTSAPQQSSYPELSRAKLLDGLMECLKYPGNRPQGQALHRSVIRLLAFIATFGDSCTAFLMEAGTSPEDVEVGQAGKNDTNVEVVAGGESSRGQQNVGGGSGSTHLRGLKSEDVLARVQNIPQKLVALINSELDMEESEGWNEPSIAEQRDRLICEAVTLLCRLSSDTVESPAVIRHLISNKDMARLTLNVCNRLATRKLQSQKSGAGQKHVAVKLSDVAELARGLRRQVLSSLTES